MAYLQGRNVLECISNQKLVSSLMTLLAQSNYLMLRTHKIGMGPLGLSFTKRATSEPISEKKIIRIRVYTVCVDCVFLCVCAGLHNSLDLNSLKKDISVYQAFLQAYIMHSCVCVFLTMWMLPAAPPNSGTHCQ